MMKKLVSCLLAVMTLMTVLPTAAFAGREMHPLISPNPVIAPNPSAGYADLAADHWAFADARKMVDAEYIDLAGENTFAPDELFTRGMLVTALWRMSGKPAVNFAMTFTDVEEGSEEAEAIRWAASEKIVSGFEDNTFRAADSVTREQMATMIYNFVKKLDMGFKGAWMFHLSYADAQDISEWAFEPVMWMVSSRIFKGVTETQLMPQGTVTRAQGAVMLSRLLDTAEAKEVDFRNYTQIAREVADKLAEEAKKDAED